MGLRRSSTLYCADNSIPRSKGTQVPTNCQHSRFLLSSRVQVMGTLILAVSALNFLVHSFLDFSFKDAGSLRFIKVGDFKYLSGIHP